MSSLMNNSSTTDTPNSDICLNPIITSSVRERWITFAAIVVFAIFAVLGQSSVIVAITRSSLLELQHFVLILSMCCSDLLMVVLGLLMYISPLVTDSTIFNGCIVITSMGVTIAYANGYHIGIMAFERLVFFCYPLKYELMITPRRLLFTVALIYALILAYVITVGQLVGREYHAATLICNLASQSLIRKLLVVGIMWIAPTCFLIYCMYCLHRLINRCSVSPAGSIIPVKQATTTLRLILLISGMYWGSYIPVVIIRNIILAVGYTLHDLDCRVAIIPAIIMRVVSLVGWLLPPICNPFIYYCTRPDLRKAFKILNANSLSPTEDWQ